VRRASLCACLATLLVLGAATAGAEEALADPTRPPAHVEDLEGAFLEASMRLSAIWIGPLRRVAVIDGRAVGEGDSVGGYEVVEIHEAGVRLAAGARVWELRLLGRGVVSGGDGS
jgi:hypothetical protein